MKIGVTEMHGIADEYLKNPPENVSFHKLKVINSPCDKLITSTAKGVLRRYDSSNVDLIEAPLFPILTEKPWIYTPADAHSAMAFGFINMPTPRFLREIFLRRIFEKRNFKALIFKSNAGLETLCEYPILNSKAIRDKSTVIYPAIREISNDLIQINNNSLNIVFVGDFFRKGGVHVVDAYLELKEKYKHLNLYLYSDPELKTKNEKLRQKYKALIVKNKIPLSLVSRDELFKNVYPNAGIFVSPTYQETFGFAILEAMAFGIPCVSTNIFAIPEIIEHESSGYLIDIKDCEFIKSIKGYVFDYIPDKFHKETSEKLYSVLEKLVQNDLMRKNFSLNSLNTARTKFSINNRNEIMKELYCKIINEI